MLSFKFPWIFIWELIEDGQSVIFYFGQWKQCRVDEILADTYAWGVGFDFPGDEWATYCKFTLELLMIY